MQLIKTVIIMILVCFLVMAPALAENDPEIEMKPERITMKRPHHSWNYYYIPLDQDNIEGTWSMNGWFESYESNQEEDKWDRSLYEDAQLPNGDNVEIKVESDTELRLPQDYQQYFLGEAVWTVTPSGQLASKTRVFEKDDMIGTGTITVTISGRLDRVSPGISTHVDEETYYLNFFVDQVQDYVLIDSEFNRNRSMNTPGERVLKRVQYRFRYEKPIEEASDTSVVGELLNSFESAWNRLKSAVAGETFKVKVPTQTAGVRG